ncbi:MAG: hypothetical protein N4A47_00585 [Clostridia bacterium]|jgi:hypothetical protein|nr:hypothetical protein [Clostridia bacterium]
MFDNEIKNALNRSETAINVVEIKSMLNKIKLEGLNIDMKKTSIVELNKIVGMMNKNLNLVADILDSDVRSKLINLKMAYKIYENKNKVEGKLETVKFVKEEPGIRKTLEKFNASKEANNAGIYKYTAEVLNEDDDLSKVVWEGQYIKNRDGDLMNPTATLMITVAGIEKGIFVESTDDKEHFTIHNEGTLIKPNSTEVNFLGKDLENYKEAIEIFDIANPHLDKEFIKNAIEGKLEIIQDKDNSLSNIS